MSKPLARKVVKTDPNVELNLRLAIEERAIRKTKEVLKNNIDELGTCKLILAPFIETIKRHDLLQDKVKNAMVKLKLDHFEGKTFQATRTETDCRILDQELVEKVLGDLDAYKKDGKRNSIKVSKKDGTV